MTKIWDLIVVGGGASGMMTAILAARLGQSVMIIERNNRLGKKILMTGNGTCNLTNIYDDSTHFHSQEVDFINRTIPIFNHENTIDFFNQLGIETTIEERGKVYPMVKQASAVLDVLLLEIKALDINVLVGVKVTNIEKNECFKLICDDGSIHFGHKCCLATGGKAAPDTGSDGNGHLLATLLGHHVSPIFPSLIQLSGKNPFLKELKGTKINGNVSVYVDDQFLFQDTEEILFTDYGLSGPAIINISRYAAEGIYLDKKVYVEIDFLPHLSYDVLFKKLIDRLIDHPYRTTSEWLVGLVHKRLIQPILKSCNIPLNQTANSISKSQVKNCGALLKKFRMDIIGTHQWNQAQTTAGGVSVNEINPLTMESYKCSGLYFTGEIMDVDGDCGGFNLQWAFTSAYIASQSICLSNS